MRNSHRRIVLATVAACAAAAASDARADSVAQVATAKRISRQTVALIDPQGRPLDAGGGGNSIVKVGDVLTFVVQFTPVPNGAYRGLGGYITEYVPPNTEVVGARITDKAGNTVSPHRGGLSCDGYGPRGKGNFSPNPPLIEGSMSQLYADTGIFYSTDARTARNSDSGGVPQPFLSLKNGIQLPVNPSGAGQFDQILNTSAPYFAHNAWDAAQVVKWGPGNGNAPEHIGSAGVGYGSPVAGPETWYGLELTIDPPGSPIIAANAKYLGNPGPWQRIRQSGSETGRRGQGDTPPSAAQNVGYLQCPGAAPTRVGQATAAGFPVTTANPLPPTTNAIRYALGELVVGDEYYAEVSLRVKALPLDPAFGNINCAEVVGGDASSRSQNGGSGGKDYLWRYFLPAPACVSLDLLFENNVSQVLAPANTTLTNTIEAKNLTTVPMGNVEVRDCFVAGDETFIAAGTTPGYVLDGAGAGCPSPGTQTALVWTVGTLMPGESKTYTAKFTGKRSTTNQAVFTSDTFPAPGFVANAYTTIGNLAVMRLGMTAAPSYVPALPASVHYTATVTNAGTAAASTTSYTVTLPSATWLYKAGSAKVNGAGVGDPTQTGASLRFAPPIIPGSIAVAAPQLVEFDVTVPVGTAPGLYTSDLTTWVKSAQDFEDSAFRIAPVAVLTAPSDAPVVTVPVAQGATTVTGTSTEAAGSTVSVYINGNVLGTGVVGAGGAYSVAVPPLVAGQRVEVTVTAAGELESPRSPSPPVIVVATAVPPDPTPKPQCSDGIDNDGDGKIDYPDDPACCSYLDNSESKDGGACVAPPACSDGIDNDGDGLIDFPFDPGCSSPLDNDESDFGSTDGGPSDAGTGGPGGITDGSVPAGRPPGAEPPDWGGVPEGDTSSGCACGVAHPSDSVFQGALAAGLMSALCLRRARRRRRPR